MSYALVLQGSRLQLGAAASASFSASATSTAKAEASSAVASQLPDCKDAELTGNAYVDKTIVECCEVIKKNRNLSLEEQFKGIAECGARGGAVATCMTAGVVTYGASTLLAPLCGEVGAFVANRVLGYSGVQLAASVTAAAACGAITGGALGPVCGIVAAELVGWLTDNVGPILESIFDPGAAVRREQAARSAYSNAIKANEASCLQADKEYRLAWGLGVGELRSLYKKAFPTAELQKRARDLLTFDGTYVGIATALIKAGAVYTKDPSWAVNNKGKTGCYPDKTWECPGCESTDFIKNAQHADPQYNGTPWEGIAASWAVYGRKEPWSGICPFSIYELYHAERTKSLGASPKRDDVTRWERSIAPMIAGLAERIYPAMVSAIASVATQITTVATRLKQDELIAMAQNASREQLATKVAVAAGRAEVAADAAKKGSAAEAKRAIVRAAQQYDIAEANYRKLLTDHFGGKATTKAEIAAQQVACMKDVYCKRALSSLIRASAAKKNAPIFAAETARNRLLLGAGIAAGAIGAAYFFTR